MASTLILSLLLTVRPLLPGTGLSPRPPFASRPIKWNHLEIGIHNTVICTFRYNQYDDLPFKVVSRSQRRRAFRLLSRLRYSRNTIVISLSRPSCFHPGLLALLLLAGPVYTRLG